MIHNRLKFTSQLISPRGWMVRSFGLAFESTGFRSQLREDTVEPHWWVLIERNRSVSGDYIDICISVCVYIYISFYKCLMAGMLICDCWFHAVLLRQSSGGEIYLKNNIHLFIIIIYSSEFFTSAWADGLSLEFEW